MCAIAGSAQAADTKPTAHDGKQVYNAYCVICHGVNMTTTSKQAFDLRKFPLSQRSRFFTSVRQGKRQMPAWKDALSDEQIEALWAYVRTRGKI